MKKTILSTLAISVFSISTAMAATANINQTVYQTRAIDNGLNNTDYRTSWSTQTSSITTQNLADFNGVSAPWGSFAGMGGFSHLKIDFSTTAKTNTSFALAPDAGYGGAIYLDGTLIAAKTSDLWWGFDWNNTSQILTAMVTNLAAGNHTFEGYWAEGCCNGGQGFQINAMATPALATPIPAAVWLFGSAMVSLVGLGRRRQTDALTA